MEEKLNLRLKYAHTLKKGMFVVELVGNGVFHRLDSSNPDF